MDMDMEAVQRIVNESLAAGAGGISPDRLRMLCPLAPSCLLPHKALKEQGGPRPGRGSLMPIRGQMIDEGGEHRAPVGLRSILDGLPPGAQVEEITVETCLAGAVTPHLFASACLPILPASRGRRVAAHDRGPR